MHHALSDERTPGFGHNGALRAAAIVIVEIRDDPIPHPAEIMGARHVGMEDGEMPIAADRMRRRKPSLAFGIPARR
jgi:hypothetical protein